MKSGSLTGGGRPRFVLLRVNLRYMAHFHIVRCEFALYGRPPCTVVGHRVSRRAMAMGMTYFGGARRYAPSSGDPESAHRFGEGNSLAFDGMSKAADDLS